MKTIKNIVGVLLALAAMTTFYSCDDDVKYTPADKLNSAQVYFPNTNSSSINLSSTANSFEIAIARIKSDEAITVPLTVVGTNGLYTFPTSVSFAQGASAAVITITYDPNAIEFDDFIELKLSIADDTYATVYGMSEYVFSVGIPAPWTEWKEFGAGDYTYAQYWAQTVSCKIYKQQSLLDPDLARFKIEGFGALNATFIFNYSNSTGNITLTEGIHVANHSSYGAIYVIDAVTYANIIRGGTSDLGVVSYDDYPCDFDEKTGLFTLNLAYYVGAGYFGVGPENLQLEGYADYSVEMTYAGTYMSTDNEVAGVLAQVNTVGEDVKGIRLAVVEGTDAQAAIDGVKSGNIDSVEAPVTTGTVLIPFATKPPVGGDYMIVAVTYADNMAQGEEVVAFTYTPAP